MAKYQCPACRRRIAEDQRCFRCGWRRSGEADVPRPAGGAGKRLRMFAAALLVMLMGAAGVYGLRGETFADWYAEFALRHLPQGFSAFAPADTPSGAFYHCVGRVVKKVGGANTVETFPSFSAENTVADGEGRYTVRATVEEVRLSGEAVQRSFTCVARFDRGRWVTESLTVE